MSGRKNDDQTPPKVTVDLVDVTGSVSVTAVVAVSLGERTRGLLGRRSMDQDTALLIRTKHIHTFGMAFPIDVVYLDRHFKVLAAATLGPGRLGPFKLATRWVLELPAGSASDLGITPGLKLEARRKRT